VTASHRDRAAVCRSACRARRGQSLQRPSRLPCFVIRFMPGRYGQPAPGETAHTAPAPRTPCSAEFVNRPIKVADTHT
jgi:hypothetical protein